MIESQIIEQTQDQLDREVACKTYKVLSADIKSSLKLKAQILQNYEFSVDTGVKTETDIWNIVSQIGEKINDFHDWDLPTAKELDRQLNDLLSDLAMRFENQELRERENKLKDKFRRLPSIETIQINCIKCKDMKIAGFSRPIFEMKYQSNDAATLLPIEYTMIITRGDLQGILSSEDPLPFQQIRLLCEEFFSEADLHLMNFNKEVEKQKNKIMAKSKEENSQLKLSIVPTPEDKSDGDIDDED